MRNPGTSLLRALRRRSELPLQGDDSSRILPWIVAVMVFLATLAGAAALAVGSAATRWERDLAGSATVQIAVPDPPVPPAVMQSRVDGTLSLLRQTPGVLQAEAVSPEAAAALIAPWLGDAAQLGDLPMPRLIDVVIDPAALDAPALRQRLTATVPGASFDDHRRWLDGLRRIARSVMLAAIGILLLVSGVAALSVIFAVRSGLAVHREVIEVLHLIGARDAYIANGFARHALLIALQGGLVGTVAAVATLLALGTAADSLAPGLLPGLTLTALDWILLALLPTLAAGLAAATARMTVMASLARLI